MELLASDNDERYPFNFLHDLFGLLLFFYKINIRVSNSLDTDQAWHFVGPDLGPNCLQRFSADDAADNLIGCQTFNLKNKVSRRQQKHEKLPSMLRVNLESPLLSGGLFSNNLVGGKGWYCSRKIR